MDLDATLTELQLRLLATIFERGAENAAAALSQWLGCSVRLTVSAVERVGLAEASELLGPEDSLVAACTMPVLGGVKGLILLVFEDRAGLALADLLLRQPLGTATAWGDLERSAALETANIVGCAYVNSLAAHLSAVPGGAIVPGPPAFRHEFAASLLEFALMDQAAGSNELLLANTAFSAEATRLDWSLLFVPGGGSLNDFRSWLSGE